MQCLRFWFTIWLCAISVNISVASPVDVLHVDNENVVGDLNTAESKKDDAVVSERDNEVGYLRQADEKGADAYQHFESFHDKDGDAYGYEKHEAYGKSNKGESLNDGKDKNEGSHYNYVQELGDKPKYQKYHGSSDDPGKSKQTNYHYSYNSDDDDNDDDDGGDKKKANYSSDYKEDLKGDDDEDDEEADNHGTDEEKTTNFSYRIVSDDEEDDGGHEDINAKGNGNGNGYYYNHGDKKTNVDYTVKKSDFIARDDSDDDDNEDEDNGSEEEEENAIVKNEKSNYDEDPTKNAKSYSTYTTYSSEEGDDDEGEDKKKNANIVSKPIPTHAIRYENSYPKQTNRYINKPKIVENDDSEEENDENDDDDDEEHENDEVVLHQPAKPVKPQQKKPLELAKEHRAAYEVQNNHPASTPAKPQVIIPPSKPIEIVHEHHAGYKVEEGDGGKGSDDSGKGHGGSVTKHLYEIYVTHDTGKASGGGGGGDAKDSGDDEEGDGKGKSENLTLEKSQQLKAKTDGNDNGTYKVNINYGAKAGSKKVGKKAYRKRKGSLKKKKIAKPNKYEVEEYVDNQETLKPLPLIETTVQHQHQQHREPIKAGKESSPQHHRDSDDYSSGQQFEFASEADSDAYYW